MLAKPTDIIKVNSGPLDEAGYYAFKEALPEWEHRLLAMLLLNTGCRIAEILRLTPAYCRLEGPEYFIYVQRGKKRKKNEGEYDQVWVNPNLGVQLRDYIKGNNISQDQRIFPYTYRWYYQVFTRAGVRPHELRGLYTRILVDNGVPVETASKMLGHSDTRTTLKHYYDATPAKRRAIGERMPV